MRGINKAFKDFSRSQGHREYFIGAGRSVAARNSAKISLQSLIKTMHQSENLELRLLDLKELCKTMSDAVSLAC